MTLHFAECDACGSEITGDAHSRANKRAVLAFRKSVDGVLTGAETRALREKYSITQDQAARLFGGGPKAFSKYEADDVAHAAAMDTLLRLALRSEDTFWELVALKGNEAIAPGDRAPAKTATSVHSDQCTMPSVLTGKPSCRRISGFIIFATTPGNISSMSGQR